ncbi:unnamed protein product, partial [Oppiella nova]
IELIDTLFILLRNGKLLTLHWIHHCLTLCYSWYVFSDIPATARWMVGMNFIAHSLMYTYYALKAMRISIPLVIIIEYKNTGIPCDASKSVVTSGLALYTLFLLMFTNFFINSYLRKQKHNFDDYVEIMHQKWHYSVYISIGYIILIPILKQWMKYRGKPYNLRTLLTFWNSFLAVFSIIGVIRCLPEFAYILSTKGFTASFCQSDYYKDLRLNWWYLFFVWSKVIELIDTLFILLRNGKLLTLHWIHHVLTLCYSWYVFGDVPATARWMVGMNFIAHSLMYTYYALKAMRISIPLVIIIEYKNTGIPCDASLSVVTSGLALYTLFLLMFTNFFINSYLRKQKHNI